MALEEERAHRVLQNCAWFHLLCKWALLSCVETSQRKPPKTARFPESDMVADAYTLSTQKAQVSPRLALATQQQNFVKQKCLCYYQPNQESLVLHRTPGRDSEAVALVVGEYRLLILPAQLQDRPGKDRLSPGSLTSTTSYIQRNAEIPGAHQGQVQLASAEQPPGSQRSRKSQSIETDPEMPLMMRLLDPEAVVKKIQKRLRVLNTDLIGRP